MTPQLSLSHPSKQPSPVLDEYGVPSPLNKDVRYIEMKEVLEEILQSKEDVMVWLSSTGRGSSVTPISQILQGNMDAARKAVYALEYGIPS